MPPTPMSSPAAPPATGSPSARRAPIVALAIGFRPFYLAASAYAAIAVPLWAAEFAGLFHGVLRSPIWHGHEMLFGFTLAVIVGFLLTAVRNWTGQPTASGWPLAALVMLWVGARVLLLAHVPLAAAIANAAFVLAAAVAVAVPLARSGLARNYFFVALLLLLGATQLALHAVFLGYIDWPQGRIAQVGADIVLFVISVMGGRVIPMFTNNALPHAQAARHPDVERAALGSTLAVLVADVAGLPEPMLATLCALAALAHGARLAGWHPWRTGAKPLVWVLHAGYAWIVVHLALRAMAMAEWVNDSLALHALTVGVVGTMTLGMMTRTARGHTGRPLTADAGETAMFVLISVAAVVRVVGGLVLPESFYLATVALAGACWALAFGLYAVRYAPILLRPRIDGKPG